MTSSQLASVLAMAWAAPALVAASSIAGLVVVAAYAGGVLVPQVVDDLHHLSHAELTS